MAPNNDASKVTDKGKGKATDGKPDETKKGKDALPQPNGKRDDDKVDGGLHFLPGVPVCSLANCVQLQRN